MDLILKSIDFYEEIVFHNFELSILWLSSVEKNFIFTLKSLNCLFKWESIRIIKVSCLLEFLSLSFSIFILPQSSLIINFSFFILYYSLLVLLILSFLKIIELSFEIGDLFSESSEFIFVLSLNTGYFFRENHLLLLQSVIIFILLFLKLSLLSLKQFFFLLKSLVLHLSFSVELSESVFDALKILKSSFMLFKQYSVSVSQFNKFLFMLVTLKIFHFKIPKLLFNSCHFHVCLLIVIHENDIFMLKLLDDIIFVSQFSLQRVNLSVKRNFRIV